MLFPLKLVPGKLIKRYKRFLADVELESGEILTVHVPNSGSMLGVSTPGSPCLLSVSKNPVRKLSHTLELVQCGEKWVGVNTANTNKLVHEAFLAKLIPHWNDFTEIKPEVKINSATRLDFLLSNGQRKRYVEVKNVSMSDPPWAVFPDAVTVRGLKHLEELMLLNSQGFETELFFVVQRTDCEKFKPADHIDPAYGKALRRAMLSGVQMTCWQCEMGPSEIRVNKALQLFLD